MARAVVTSDLHLHPFRVCSRDGGRDRLRDGLAVLAQTLEMARAHHAAWFHLGDLKIPKYQWPQEALSGALDLLRTYSDVQPKLLLRGNHDETGGLAPFEECAWVAETPGFLRPADLGKWAGPGFVLLPAGATVGDLPRPPRRDEVVLAHGFLAGVLLGTDEMRLPGLGLRLSDLGVGPGRAVLGLLGDIHKGQVLVCDPKKPPVWRPYRALDGERGRALRTPAPWRSEVFYPGSPYPQTWGEREDGQKGALLVDFDTGQVDLLPTLAPQFIHLEILDEAQMTIARLGAQAATWHGQFVRLLVGEWATKPAVWKVLDKLRALADARAFEVVVQHQARAEQRAPIHAGLPVGDLLKRYVDARPFAGDSTSAVVLEAGRRLIKDA